MISIWKRESANEIITHRWHFQRSPTDDIGCSIRKLVDIDDNSCLVKKTEDEINGVRTDGEDKL